MEIYFKIIPIQTLLFICLQAVLLWGVLKLMKYMLQLFYKRQQGTRILFYYDVFVGTVWFLFILYIMVLILSSYFLTTFVCVLLVALLAWKSLRNWISGLIFRLYKGDITGSVVKIEDKEGIVDSWGYFQFCLRLQDESFVHIPYEKVFSVLFVEAKAKKNIGVKYFSIEVDGLFSPKEMEAKIRTKLLTIPWVLSCEGVSFSTTNDWEKRKINVAYVLSQNEQDTKVKEELRRFIAVEQKVGQ